MDSLMMLPEVALYAVYLIIIYYSSLIGYRLLAHPLRHHPGPLVAKLTDCYGAFYAMKTDLHLKTWQDHLKYGPVVRQGPNKLVFNTVTALHDIYQNENVTKSRAYLVTQRGKGVYSLFNAIPRNVHRTKRKIVGQVVNERSMRIFEPTMMEQVDIFIQQLFLSCQDGGSSTSINMTERCKNFVMDVVGYLSFAYPLELQTKPTYRFIFDSMNLANYFLNINIQMPILANMKAELFIYIRAVMRGKSYLRTIQKMISTRLSKDQHAEYDFYSFVGDSMKISKEDSIWTSEIWSEAIFFLSAGGDTTATGLSALFFYLSRNPRCYRLLAEEVRSAFNSGTEIRSGPQLAGCHYLRACFDEALRMSPPLAGTLWREQAFDVDDDGAKAKTLIVDGLLIPPGTQVGVNIYSIHHNEDYFPDPFAFKPERWLPGDPEAIRNNKGAFTPFSIGGRGCAGKAMAYLEASLIMAKTLWYFDFERAEGEAGELGGGRDTGVSNGRGRKDEYQLHNIFVSVHDGPCLNFRPRGDFIKELSKGQC